MIGWKKTVEDFGAIPLDERLKKAGAIDLRDNHTIEDHGNGYVTIHPIDRNKKWGDES